MQRLKLKILYQICPTILLYLIMMVYKTTSATTPPISAPIDPSYFGSHYIKLSSMQIFGTTNFSNPKPFDNFQCPLGKVYTNVKKYNIILSSFKCQTLYNFGIKLDVAIIGNPTSQVNITVEQLNSTLFSKVGVSVILIAEPFDQVMTILEYNLDMPGVWHAGQNLSIPASRQYYTYIKSMNIKSTSSPYYFQVTFNTTIVNSSRIDVMYYCYPNKSIPTYDQKIQVLIIFVDHTTKNTIVQFNFLSISCVQQFNPAFPSESFGIDIIEYGTDFNKKCIFGMSSIYSFNYDHPYLLFDLDPAIGVINGQQSLISTIRVRAFCFRELQCPVDFPFKKLGDHSNCYNCLDGVNVNLPTIPYCMNSSSYDITVQKVSYSSTGDITGYCKKCIDCNNLYYAENGTCHLCSLRFPYCQTCDQKNECLACFSTAILNSNNLCILCSVYISNCLQCNSVINCLKCNDGFYLDNGNCIQCSLAIEGCIKCNSRANCSSCNSPLVPMNLSGKITCECQKGWRVTSTCTLIYGCISSHKVGNQTLCYACNSTGNFMYVQGHTCICDKGFKFNNQTYTCDSICADGIYVNSEGCDDKNRDRGDGCDDNCNIQPNFICDNIYSSQSICRLNMLLNTTVYSLSRKFGTSFLILKLKYDLFHNFIQHNSWESNVIVNSSKITFMSYQFDNDILVLYYSIAESIEYEILEWTLLYDSKKFLTQNQSLSILMKGQNAPLTYQKYYSHQLIIYIISYVLGGLSLVIAIVAMAKAESNIAFQLSTTLLFIFYARMLTFSSNSAMIYTLGGFRAASGWNQFMLDQHRDYLQFITKNRFFLKSQISLDIIFTLGVILLLLVIKLFLQCKYIYEQIFDTKITQKQQQLQEGEKSFLRHFYINYDRFEKKFTTPITLISMFTVLVAFDIQETIGLRYQSHLPPVVSNLIRAFFFLIIFYYAGMIGVIMGALWNSLQVEQPKKRKNNKQLQFKTYTNTYSDTAYVYWIFLVMMIVFSLDHKREKSQFGFLIEICFGIILFYTIVIILMRPYNDKLSQFAIITHQVIKFLFLVFLYLLELSFLTEFIQLISVYFFLGLILLIEIISIIRIKKSWIPFKTQQQKKKQQKLKKNGNLVSSQYEQQKKKKKKYQKDDLKNFYRYENILKRQKQDQQKNIGFVKDDRNILQTVLKKDNLNNLLLGKHIADDGSGECNERKDQSNFIDDEIIRRQRTEQLRKLKQKMRKQCIKPVPINNNSLNSSDKQETWRSLTHQQQLQKKYQYDVWREKNIQRAMWEEEQKIKTKIQNKKDYGIKNT